MPSVYIETSIVSYLTARPSSSPLVAAWQDVTVLWWNHQRQDTEHGHPCPEICTPQEMIGGLPDEG